MDFHTGYSLNFTTFRINHAECECTIRQLENMTVFVCKKLFCNPVLSTVIRQRNIFQMHILCILNNHPALSHHFIPSKGMHHIDHHPNFVLSTSAPIVFCRASVFFKDPTLKYRSIFILFSYILNLFYKPLIVKGQFNLYSPPRFQ